MSNPPSGEFPKGSAEAGPRLQQFRALAVRAPVGLFLCDEAGNCVFVNEKWCEFAGVPAQEALGRGWLQAVHPDDRDRVANEWPNVAGQHASFQMETRLLHPGGTVRHFQVTTTALMDFFGKVCGYVGALADVSSQHEAMEALRRSEAALRASEARYRAAAEASLDAFYLLQALRNDAGKIVEFIFIDCNTRGAALVKRTRAQVIGMHLCRDMPYYKESGLFDKYANVVETRQAFTEEFPINAHDLTESTYLSIMVVPVEDGVAVTTRDISEQKEFERELVANKEAAEAATRAKSDFLATVSHEIRTPMNGILGMTSIMLEDDLTPHQSDSLQVVHTSAGALLNIINDILDLSKIEAGKLEIEPVPFNLRAAFEEVCELLQPRAQERGLELVFRYQPGQPTRFIGDPGRLRQVLINLAGNAIKFTEKGHVYINVQFRNVTVTSAELHVDVEDTGVGIPSDKLSLLFQKFSQADTSSRRRFGGTGLGLAISKQLVEMMGGAIGVRSGDGQGSTFTFHVPLKRDHQGTQRLEPVKDFSHIHALIVDDNPINRRVLREQLEAWRMSVTEAESASEALRLLREAVRRVAPFPLVLSDWCMPQMDGEDLAEAVKQEPMLAGTRLIALTSSPERATQARLLELGYSGFLVKPVRADHLRQTIGLVLSESGDHKSLGLITSHTLVDQRAEHKQAQFRKAIPRQLPCRVLLAEDNAVNQLVARKMLESLGCEVESAQDGREALEMVQKAPYALVLMDVQMPEMDGHEATREIRQLGGHFAELPIIAMTANAMEGERERCLAAGMSDYLSKPVEKAALKEALHRWNGGESSAQ